MVKGDGFMGTLNHDIWFLGSMTIDYGQLRLTETIVLNHHISIPLYIYLIELNQRKSLHDCAMR